MTCFVRSPAEDIEYYDGVEQSVNGLVHRLENRRIVLRFLASQRHYPSSKARRTALGTGGALLEGKGAEA